MNIKEAIQDFLNKNPWVEAKLDEAGAEVAVSGLPDEYNEVEYKTVINGKWVKTVGEYKTEASKYDYW